MPQQSYRIQSLWFVVSAGELLFSKVDTVEVAQTAELAIAGQLAPEPIIDASVPGQGQVAKPWTLATQVVREV